VKTLEITVRSATTDDYDELSSILGEVDAMHVNALPNMFRPTYGPARSPDFISDILANDDAAILVAESHGHMMGVVVAFVQATRAIPAIVPIRYATIDTLVVR
jgi:hypothetical protein